MRIAANLVPKTLRARLFLILLAGLVAAYGLSFSLFFIERSMAARTMMLGTLERDLATSIAIIDRLPAAERADWLDRLSRGNYRLVLGKGLDGVPDMSGQAMVIAKRIEEAAGSKFPVQILSVPAEGGRLQGHLTLSDGSPLTIDVTPTGVMPVAGWLPYVFSVQMAVLLFCAWLAVRQAMRPLGDLSAAVGALDPNRPHFLMAETGPREVAEAARVFNAMRQRIADYLEERVQILAAISHDLQTPITRMRLRADIADDTPDKEKLVSDLRELEQLVQDGIAYARSSRVTGERMARIDLHSFIDSIAYDYRDTGQPVTVVAAVRGSVITNPHALRRVLTNFIDNALKFGGSAEIDAEMAAKKGISIRVLDRGPGIPDDMLTVVTHPFFRLETSRNRETGGTGLGLAIAQQLATSMGARIRLYNRVGGGLVAEVIIDQGDPFRSN